MVPGTLVTVDAVPKDVNTDGDPSPPYVFQAAGNAVRIRIEHHGGAPPIVYSCTGGRDVKVSEGTEKVEATAAETTTKQK